MIRLLHDHVIVKMDKDETESRGGILVVEGRTSEPGGLIWGTVLQVGPGRVTRKGAQVPPDVKKGDRVMFCRYLRHVESNKSMQAIMDEVYGERTLMIEEKDIVCAQDGEADPEG